MAGAFARSSAPAGGAPDQFGARPEADKSLDRIERRTAAVHRFVRVCDRHFGAMWSRSRVYPAPPRLDRQVLLELLALGSTTAAQIARDLGSDVSHLSRTLVRLEDRGLIERRRLQADSRKRLLLLTAEGRALARELDGLECQKAREVEPRRVCRRLIYVSHAAMAA